MPEQFVETEFKFKRAFVGVAMDVAFILFALLAPGRVFTARTSPHTGMAAQVFFVGAQSLACVPALLEWMHNDFGLAVNESRTRVRA